MTGFILIVASVAVADDRDHQNPATQSHGAVISHDATPPHGHPHDASVHGETHTGHHHNHGEQGHTHWGHSILRWFHNLIGRGGHSHVDPHPPKAPAAPHGAGHDHAGTGHPETHQYTSPCHNAPLQ